MSKDATIREIHHRVKNNLQTISSLLRLQARRLTSPEAIAAVGESVRRIRTIALVHESLSREPGDDVTFIEIVRPLLRLAEESLQSPDRPVEFSLVGDGGRIPARVATPLSVVLTELLQNAVDHGFPEGSGGGRVVVVLNNDGEELSIDVIDDGHGLEPTFRIESATGLGLSIVRTLVTTELNGTIAMRPAKPVDLEPVGLEAHGGDRQGTVVQLVGAAEAIASLARAPTRLPCAARSRARCRRMTRRSSSDSPPQIPESWLVSRANSRHSARTSHSPHTCLAFSSWSRAMPVVPIGKNSSGSVSRHSA